MESFEKISSLTPEIAVKQEIQLLERLRQAGGKAKALIAVFTLLTVAACEKSETPAPAARTFEQGAPQAIEDTTVAQPKTKIETRIFKGYGIERTEKVEVDENGNVLRVISSQSPYGSSR